MSQAPVQCARVLRLGLNTHGRDFVVGDIHGAFDSLLESTEQLVDVRDGPTGEKSFGFYVR